MAYVVRYGRMRFLGEYAGPEDQDHFRGQRVVLRTDRGTETDEDLEHEAMLIQAQKKAFDVCQALISRRRLQMDLVDVEIILGRERIVFYYLAEKRVDFRELVKDLARALRTRIEMRQIGVRDEAKLLADYGDCGKPVCCNMVVTRAISGT